MDRWTCRHTNKTDRWGLGWSQAFGPLPPPPPERVDNYWGHPHYHTHFHVKRSLTTHRRVAVGQRPAAGCSTHPLLERRELASEGSDGLLGSKATDGSNQRREGATGGKGEGAHQTTVHLLNLHTGTQHVHAV